MAITYTWNCTTVDTYPTKSDQTDVIFNVHWRLNGVDDTEDENVGDSYGVVSLDTEDLSTFTAFADITEANVISWVEAALGEIQVAALKASIDAQIAEKITPTVVTKQIGV
tara:strand:- start:1283 stop:1615 length:333 start_codon:yes stop_codon:yes gene_type:complete